MYCPAGVAVVLVRTPAEVSVTPVGSVPVSVNVGVGKPLAASVNDPAVPLVNEVVAALVIEGARSTFSVKAWVAAVPTPLLAVMVNLYCPAGVAVVLVRTPAELRVTPVGRVPDSV